MRVLFSTDSAVMSSCTGASTSAAAIAALDWMWGLSSSLAASHHASGTANLPNPLGAPSTTDLMSNSTLKLGACVSSDTTSVPAPAACFATPAAASLYAYAAASPYSSSAAFLAAFSSLAAVMQESSGADHSSMIDNFLLQSI
jgi:hypothetical protein